MAMASKLFIRPQMDYQSNLVLGRFCEVVFGYDDLALSRCRVLHFQNPKCEGRTMATAAIGWEAWYASQELDYTHAFFQASRSGISMALQQKPSHGIEFGPADGSLHERGDFSALTVDATGSMMLVHAIEMSRVVRLGMPIEGIGGASKLYAGGTGTDISGTVWDPMVIYNARRLMTRWERRRSENIDTA
jgi:hypothetical protein